MYKEIVRVQAEALMNLLEEAIDHQDTSYFDSILYLYKKIIYNCKDSILHENVTFTYKEIESLSRDYVGADALKSNLNMIIKSIEEIDKKEETYVKPSFEYIRRVIIEQIKSSKYIIWIAVAWFTDRLIFNELLNATERGVNVQVILLDQQNKSSKLSFTGKIEAHYFPCYAQDQENLHDKFCVFDFATVIQGSYNWTLAASYNLENITLIKDRDVAFKFADEFIRLKKKAIQK